MAPNATKEDKLETRSLQGEERESKVERDLLVPHPKHQGLDFNKIRFKSSLSVNRGEHYTSHCSLRVLYGYPDRTTSHGIEQFIPYFFLFEI